MRFADAKVALQIDAGNAAQAIQRKSRREGQRALQVTRKERVQVHSIAVRIGTSEPGADASLDREIGAERGADGQYAVGRRDRVQTVLAVTELPQAQSDVSAGAVAAAILTAWTPVVRGRTARRTQRRCGAQCQYPVFHNGLVECEIPGRSFRAMR